MARLVYSLSGEGRGHATRAETVISMLSPRHHLLVYAPPIAHETLRHAFESSPNVVLRSLDCLRFRYRGEKLSYLRSTVGAVPFLCKMEPRIRRISREVREWGATHIINDFEPLLSRVARRLSLPWIGLDHQHFLTAIDSRCLPAGLARKVRFLRPSVWMFCPVKGRQIVSSYFDFQLRESVQHSVRKTGVLLRDAVLNSVPDWGEHIVAYMRRDLPRKLLQSMQASGRDVYVYGLGEREAEGKVRFHKTSTVEFLDHLRSCAALVCSSGNQLIGEAMHFGKPTLAVPERGNFEQEINGFFLPKTGAGNTVAACDLERSTIAQFLEERERYMTPERLVSSGNTTVRDQLEAWIDPDPKPSRPTIVEPVGVTAA